MALLTVGFFAVGTIVGTARALLVQMNLMNRMPVKWGVLLALSLPAGLAQVSNAAASAAAFEAIVPVLRNPRCINCHSTGDYPRQGDDSQPHTMLIRRGTDGNGFVALKCSACHQDRNFEEPGMPPGALGWHLPHPATPMIWEGQSSRKLCELFKDPKQNGQRTVSQIVDHMSTPLTLWGWNPGPGRKPIPMPHAEFLAKVKEWASKGAVCPAE